MMRLSVLTLLLSAPLLCFADETKEISRLSDDISAGLSFGSLSGEAKERVYEGKNKISQLNWKYNNAAIIKGEIAWDIMPWTTLGINGWTTLASKGSHMDDYDWDSGNQSRWTDHSSHPDTTLNYANEFDINIKGWLLKEENYRVGLMAGYKQSSYSWGSKGGSYNYDNGNDVGEFDKNERSIGYNQKFKTPYIGVTGLYRYENIEMSATFNYSGWVRATDNDEHYTRTTTFKGKVDNQDYYFLSATGAYYVTDNMKVYVEGVWSRMLNKKGTLSAHNYKEGTNIQDDDASGIEHTNIITTAGLKYNF
jgi:omptin